MTDPGKRDDDELDIDLQLALEPLDTASDPGAGAPSPTPDAAAAAAAAHGAEVVAEPPGATSPATASAAAASAADADDADLVPGQWVWQYGAPPPPPSFSAVFFSGRALAEVYRFFACGLLVFVGCLLPWGRSVQWVVQHGESTLGYSAPPAGYEVPVGALSLAIAIWLMFVAGYGIYTGRQKVLPVFLMLVPAYASWTRTLTAWREIAALPQKLGTRDQISALFEVAGTGVLLTLIGSSIIVLSLAVVIVKVFKKQPGEADKGAARPPRKSKDGGKDSKKEPASVVGAASAAGMVGAAAADAPAMAEPSAGAKLDKGKATDAGGKGEGGRRGRRR